MKAAAVFLAKCSALWLVLAAGLPALGPMGGVAAHVVAPPLATTLIGICGGQPCLAVPPLAALAAPAQPALVPPQDRSRRRLTRRST